MQWDVVQLGEPAVQKQLADGKNRSPNSVLPALATPLVRSPNDERI